LEGYKPFKKHAFLRIVGGKAAHYAQKEGFVGKVQPSPRPFA